MSDPQAEYPKAAYQLGTEFAFEGKTLDMRSLKDAEDETQALSEGWSLSPAVEANSVSAAIPFAPPPAEDKPEE